MAELRGKEFHDALSAKCVPAVVKPNRRPTAQAALMRKYKVHAKFRSQNLKDHFKYLRANGREAIRRLIHKYEGKVRSGFIWLRIGTSRGLLLTR